MSIPRKEFLVHKLVNHGKDIFAYSHVHTNQVIYSLERSLNNQSAINQLAYAGKTTVPAHLRKDLWRPLWAVEFPSPRQGLAAFRTLREWKKLHELSWDPKDLPELQLSEDERLEKEKNDKKLQEDGGRRVGGRRLRRTEYKKRKMTMIMDQKANSIADLAKVLLEQKEMGDELRKERDLAEHKRRTTLYQTAAALAREAEINDGIPKVDSAITEATTSLEALEAKPIESRTKDERNEIRTLRKTITDSRARRAKMEALRHVFAPARAEHDRLAAEAIAANREKFEAESRAQGRDPSRPGPAFEYKQFRFSDILEENVYDMPIFDKPLPDASKMPKRGHARKIMKETLNPVPIFTPEGVKVRWANILDAEFAPEWPRAVEHNVIGLTRNTAPKMSDEPRLMMEDRYVYDAEGDKLDDEEAKSYLLENQRDGNEISPLLTPVLENMRLTGGERVGARE